MVYTPKVEDIKKLHQNGILKQDNHETLRRHKDAIKKFYKMTKWFDYDIFRLFIDSLKDREPEELDPSKKELIINYTDYLAQESLEINELPEGEESEAIKKEYAENIPNDKLIYTERELHYSRLKAGMIAIEDIKTINEITALKAETVIDNENIRKLSQLALNKMIPTRLKFKVPTYNY